VSLSCSIFCKCIFHRNHLVTRGMRLRGKWWIRSRLSSFVCWICQNSDKYPQSIGLIQKIGWYKPRFLLRESYESTEEKYMVYWACDFSLPRSSQIHYMAHRIHDGWLDNLYALRAPSGSPFVPAYKQWWFDRRLNARRVNHCRSCLSSWRTHGKLCLCIVFLPCFPIGSSQIRDT
jgi:hypothetical protein